MHTRCGKRPAKASRYGDGELSFEEIKARGVGREYGPETVDRYLQPKGVLIVNVSLPV